MYFLEYFVEIDEFGWNWLTASFLTLFLITTWQWRAFTRQAIRIWKNKNATSVSLTVMAFMFFTNVGAVVYGLDSQKLAIFYTGTTFLAIGWILWGGWKFKKATKLDKLALTACLLGTLLYFTPISSAWIYLGFVFAGVWPFVDQLLELYRTKSPGELDPEWLHALLAKTVLWNIWAFSARDPVYMIFAPVFCGMVVWVTALRKHYERKEKEHRASHQGVVPARDQ